VTLRELRPPAVDHEIAFTSRIADPPLSSQAGSAVLAELEGASLLGQAGPLGLELTFDDPAAPIGNFGFNGPVKPSIDALGPLLGWQRPKKGGRADHRIHDFATAAVVSALTERPRSSSAAPGPERRVCRRSTCQGGQRFAGHTAASSDRLGRSWTSVTQFRRANRNN
jgi:hypothetical protein